MTPREQKIFSRRSFVLKLVSGVPFAVLGLRLFDLQVLNKDKYLDLSKGNRVRLFSTEASRGLIYDRNQAVLAKNIPSYNLIIILEDCPDLNGILRKVSNSLEIEFDVLKKRIKENRRTKFSPITIEKDLSWRQLAIISGYQEEFPGIDIEYVSIRRFLYGEQNAHILGYLGKINEAQLKKYGGGRRRSANILGQEGLESELNDVLIGYDGGEQSEVDSVGRVIKVLNSIAPIPGRSVELTIDNRLQGFIHESFVAEDRKGASIVMNPFNGEIIGMVSFPSFDPNLFSKGIQKETWEGLLSDPANVLNNRAIKGQYSPGSTFKILIALAALSEGLIDERTIIDCPGYYKAGSRLFNCWKRSGHGSLDLKNAIEQSCNVFFYKLGKELGVEKIKKYGEMFGFGQVTGIGLKGEVGGLLPDPEWKKRHFNASWQTGETINFSIGQGYLSVTPLQLISYLNMILNKGTRYSPTLIKKIADYNTDELNSFRSKGLKIPKYEIDQRKVEVNMASEYYDLVMEGMKMVIQGPLGTARGSNSKIVSLAGKTGTTQVISGKTKQKILKEKKKLDTRFLNHAWFMGYAPAENPKVSFVTLLEHGDKGSNAARFTKKIAEFYSNEIDSLSSIKV